MNDIISTDAPLTGPQRILLSALLDTLVPASEDGEMPSAAEVDFERYLLEQGENIALQLPSIFAHFESTFATLSLEARCEQLRTFSSEHPELFHALLPRVYDCYYQDDRVRRKIGMVTGAVFPEGNTIVAGDLSLLDPVIDRDGQHRYRPA